MKSVIFSSYPKPSNSAAEQQCSDNLFRLGFLGRIKLNKGIDYLVRHFMKLPEKDYELFVAGKDELGLSKVHQRNNIHFLGYIEPEVFFSQIDLLIVPSLWHDPLPRTIFEAYAHGIPVIGTKRGGIPEIIDEGISGFTYEPQNPLALIELLKFIKNHPELLREMKRNALKKYSLFRPENSANKYVAIYKKLIDL
jgi:glycosyltransferase involved in cell wall biosynthesis